MTCMWQLRNIYCQAARYDNRYKPLWVRKGVAYGAQDTGLLTPVKRI